jgi:hypothetical protein
MPERVDAARRGSRRKAPARAPVPRRVRYLAVAVTEGGVVALALALAVALRPDSTPHPERVSANVARCDLGLRTAAQITYTVTNGDRSRHGYRVELLVVNSATPVGAGVNLINRVPPGATVTGRALVPVSGDPAGARCEARAKVFDGHSGHHG